MRRPSRSRPGRARGGTVRLPGSKSISNRVLLLAALARGETEVCGLLDADDTRVMRDALRRSAWTGRGARRGLRRSRRRAERSR